MAWPFVGFGTFTRCEALTLFISPWVRGSSTGFIACFGTLTTCFLDPAEQLSLNGMYRHFLMPRFLFCIAMSRMLQTHLCCVDICRAHCSCSTKAPNINKDEYFLVILVIPFFMCQLYSIQKDCTLH